MTPRRSARAHHARAGARPAPTAILAGAILGGVIGWAAAPWVATRLGPPVPLDRSEWSVIVPGHDEGLADSELASGTGVVDGVLLISVRGFGRADMLIPVDARPVGRLAVTLAADSGSVVVNMRNEGAAANRPIELGPTGFRVDSAGEWTSYPRGGDVELSISGGAAAVDGLRVSEASPGTIELTPGTESARIRHLAIDATDGSAIFDRTFEPPRVTGAVRIGLAVAGAWVGCAFAVVTASGASAVGGGVVGVLGVLPLFFVLHPHYPFWRSVCHRLYLLHTSAAWLRTVLFGVSIAFLCVVALISSGWLTLPRRAAAELPVAAILAIVGISVAVGSRDLSGVSILFVLPGFLFAGASLWAVRSAGLPLTPAFVRDAPALFAVAAGTWTWGFLPAVVWRFVCLLVDAPTFAERSPRAGSDLFFVLLLALPLSAELALRGTYLDETWTPKALAGATLGGSPTDGAAFTPYWSSECGESGPVKTVYAFGGSSTGGAYQFRGEPTAFFPAKLLDALCATPSTSPRFAMRNFGDSGRDSFDIAQGVAAAYASAAPAVAIFYLGVNDLLTTDAPLTRKQRAARLAERQGTTQRLDALSSASRLLTGLSLVVRAPPEHAAMVAAVPLADAEENLRRAIAATTGAGGRVVLVTEFVQAAVAPQLRGYSAMEERLSRELPGVQYLDLTAKFTGVPESVLLADRNHLTREGSQRVADLLLPMVAAP